LPLNQRIPLYLFLTIVADVKKGLLIMLLLIPLRTLMLQDNLEGVLYVYSLPRHTEQ
jgi:hypothetical protein